MLSFEDKIFIKNLWLCKRFSARRLLREYPNKNWKRRMLDEFLRRLRTTGLIKRKARPWVTSAVTHGRAILCVFKFSQVV